jgi:hypothetical protein
MVNVRPEGAVVAAILLGIGKEFPLIKAWRSNTGSFKDERGQFVKFGLVGSADISGIIGPVGIRLEIECKAVRGKQTVQQRCFEDMIVAAGGVYILAWTWESCRAWLLNAVAQGGRACPSTTTF